jgi:hypothetical protein
MFEREEQISVYLLLGFIPFKQTICSYFKADVDTNTSQQSINQSINQASKQARNQAINQSIKQATKQAINP